MSADAAKAVHLSESEANEIVGDMLDAVYPALRASAAYASQPEPSDMREVDLDA